MRVGERMKNSGGGGCSKERAAALYVDRQTKPKGRGADEATRRGCLLEAHPETGGRGDQGAVKSACRSVERVCPAAVRGQT